MRLEQLKKLKLLYIEDDDITRQEYSKTFNIIFKKTFEASNFENAITLYEKESPDLIIIDIELKKRQNGFDIAEEIRKKDLLTPIIFLTGHGESEYIQKAINNNINGYIVKPLSLQKLIDVTNKCVKIINNNNKISISKNLDYNMSTYELLDKDKVISLGKKENKLLLLLLENKNKTLSRDAIEYEIWNNEFISDSALKNLICTLRKKIGKDKISNISGLGWRINID